MSEFLFVVIVAFFLTIAAALATIIVKRVAKIFYQKVKNSVKKRVVIGKIK